MKNSSYTGMGIIVVAAVLWAAHSFKGELRGQLRDRSATGEVISSPSRSVTDVAARGSISSRTFDIKNFKTSDESVDSKEGKTVHRSLKEMQRLLRCFESENCNYDQSTATSYRTALREELSREMMNFQELVEEQGSYDSKLSQRAEEVAQFFLSFPDDDIKDQALSLASALPASNATCDAIIAGLSESASAPLYEKGIEELKRYIGTTEKNKVDTFLAHTIGTGSTFVSKTVASQTLPFIDPQSAPIYTEALNQLPGRSQEHEMLKANLDESARM